MRKFPVFCDVGHNAKRELKLLLMSSEWLDCGGCGHVGCEKKLGLYTVASLRWPVYRLPSSAISRIDLLTNNVIYEITLT